MDSDKFFSKLIVRIILLLVITALLILVSISCKKDAEITTNSDTTLILKDTNTQVGIFNFLVYVVTYNKASGNYEPIDANLTVSVNNNIILDTVLEAKTNYVSLRDGSSDYMLKITKQNYISYTDTFTPAELKAKFIDPLIIIIQPVTAKSSIAYSP